MTACDAVNRAGHRCVRPPRFVLTHPTLGRKEVAYRSCGVHLTSFIRDLLPRWGYVGVGEER